MTNSFGLTFVVAGVLAMVAMPGLRRLALVTGFVDHPAERKSHARAVPYLGGVGVVAATVIGTLIGPGAVFRTLFLLGGATALALMGLLDDRRGLGAFVRFLAQITAALMAYAGGVQAVATDIAVVDAVITVVWIVGITNALNLLDNMDGLSSGVAGTAALAIFALALGSGQQGVATVAIAMAGACVGFLAHNARPAAIFMGDAGSLFLGFLLAVLVLDVDPELAPPASFGIPLLLLALPVLDTVTVTVARLRRGRSVASGGKDHLSHRLVARGLSPGVAVGVLVALEAVLAAIAVLAGRGAIQLDLGLLAGSLLLAALAAATARAPIYTETVVGLPARLRLVLVAAGVGIVVVAVPASVALVRARQPILAGMEDVQAGLGAARAGDSEAAEGAFRQARMSFARAQGRLHGPLASLGLGVPALSSNMRAARTLAATGVNLSTAGERLSTSADVSTLVVQAGRVDLAEVSRLGPDLAQAATALEEARWSVQGIDNPYLLPLVRRAVRDLDQRLPSWAAEARRAADAARWSPAILGGSGPRRYLVAVQDSAEARATGGSVESFAELVAEGGAVRLERFGPIGELQGAVPSQPEPADFKVGAARSQTPRTWGNVNTSPDLPTVARSIADLYLRSGGRPIDGVVVVDPEGLATLLRLTGPVAAPPWPEPISAANLVDVALGRSGGLTPPPDRAQFLGSVAEQVARRATRGDLGPVTAVARTIGPAARGGHLAIALTRPEEEAMAASLNVGGEVPKASGDSVLVVGQNAAGNKVDLFMRRRLRYQLRLDPDDDARRARLTGQLTVTLENSAPTAGLPTSITGPSDPIRFKAGENRTFLSLYSPHRLRRANVDGQPLPLERSQDLERRVYSGLVSIPASASREVTVDVDGEVALDAEGNYRLDVLRQPLANADQVDIVVEVPRGWRVSNVDGSSDDGGRSQAVSFRLDSDRVVRLALERVGGYGWLDAVLGRH